jgi:hypothetical protein
VADAFKIMRGIPIRDCTFSDYANTLGALDSASNYYRNLAHLSIAPPPSTTVASDDYSSYPYGAGHSLVVDLTGATYTYDTIYSAVTPRGVACPYSAQAVTLWFSGIAKTCGVNTVSNTNALITAAVEGLDEDMVSTGVGAFENVYSGGYKGSVTWVTLGAKLTVTVTATTRYYRLHFGINDSSVGGDTAAKLLLDWIGLAIPYDTTNGYDAMSAYFLPQLDHSCSDRVITLSDRNEVAPYMRIDGIGGMAQNLSLRFTQMTEADKLLVSAVSNWRQGAGAPGIVLGAVAGDANRYASPRGAAMPALIIPNRTPMKLAMYADFPPPPWSHDHGGYMPEVGTYWNWSPTFQERLC